MYGSNKVADALEHFLARPRIPWTWIAVGLSIAYLILHFAIWATRGFKVVG